MKKLIILFAISLVGELLTVVYIFQKMSKVDEAMSASEFANMMTTPIILFAVWAVLFWLTLIAMTYLVVKKILDKRA
ncbi:MAG: hypothetical protein R3Y46_05075 [Opitutales bacterium]